MAMRTVVAVDKSMLAVNMYQLLFAPMDVRVINVRTVGELRAACRGALGIDCVVINGNVFAGSVERLVEQIEGDDAMTGVLKIFLLSEGDIEKGVDGRLVKLPRSEVMEKPFHPDEFVTGMRKLLALEE